MIKCLILSECLVPLPGQPRAEGGGLRSWGLARGLQANAQGFTVSLAYPAQANADDGLRVHEGIEILTWTLDALPSLVQAFDAVVVSYCAGQLAPAVVAALDPTQQLILDCNVPFYVEVSARDSRSLDDEFGYFTIGLPSITAVLKRGDVFICASERQKLYYQGVLSAIGRLNPATYHSDLLQLVPYGIHDEEPLARSRPIDLLTQRPASTRLLWFGALYPWFDISSLLEAVALLNEQGADVTLTIVGARNPQSTHRDFLASFDAFDRLVANPRYKAHTFAHGWVDFEDRADWYLNADLGVMISRPGLENSLAWRTRLVDMVWGRLPVATNAGDPLGDELVARGAAALLRFADAQQLADGLKAAIERSRGSSEMRARLAAMRRDLAWTNVTAGLAAQIRSKAKASDLSPHFIDVAARFEAASKDGWAKKLRRAGRKTKALKRRLDEHGVVATFRFLRDRVARRLGGAR